MLVTLLEKVWSLLYIRKWCYRGNKGSGTRYRRAQFIYDRNYN